MNTQRYTSEFKDEAVEQVLADIFCPRYRRASH